MRTHSEHAPALSVAGFSLVEVVLALGVTAGALTLVTGLFASLVAGTRTSAEMQAAETAAQTLRAHLDSVGFASVVPSRLVPAADWETLEAGDERVWGIDRSGSQVLGMAASGGGRSTSGGSFPFFEVMLVPLASGATLAGEIEQDALRASLVLSWPASTPEGRPVPRARRSRTVQLIFLQR